MIIRICWVGFVCCFLAACVREASSERTAQALLELHAENLKAHLENDLDAFFEPWADEIVNVSNGEATTVRPADMRASMESYLGATSFEYYRDRKPPVARVSQDGTQGWIAVEVEAKGVRRAEDGSETPFEFASAWVSLYEFNDGQWRLVGNASSFKN